MNEPRCPNFGEAIRRFQGFLESEGWPTRIRWVSELDVIRAPGRSIAIKGSDEASRFAEAERSYNAASDRGLGVLMDAICTFKGATCGVVSSPADEREAELLMFPADGGLKLSVALPRTEAVRAGRASLASSARWGVEVLVALGFLIYAAETYSHRDFSSNPRYKIGITAFAIIVGTLGFLPGVSHASPKLGRLALVVWLACVVLLLLVGALTKP